MAIALGAALAPGVAAAEDWGYTEFSNKYAYGFVRLNLNDDGTISTTASVNGKSLSPNFVSVTKVRLQRRPCDSADWVTMDARPSQDGFHEQQELDYTRRDVTRGRGWWRGTAVLAYKKKRNGPVLWKKKVASKSRIECPNVPPDG